MKTKLFFTAMCFIMNTHVATYGMYVITDSLEYKCGIMQIDKYSPKYYWATVSGCNKNYSGHLNIPDRVFISRNSTIESQYYVSDDNLNIYYEIEGIERYAFSNCTGLTSVTIPNSFYIQSYAFENCTGLTSVTIPNSGTFIGEGLFYNCSSLTSVNIPNSFTSIKEKFFYKCSSLTSVNIPDSVISIERNAFSYCSSLSSVTFPDGVEQIASQAFLNCSSLKNIKIGKKMNSIAKDAFSGCDSITSITLCSNSLISRSYLAVSQTNMSHLFGEHVKEYIIGNEIKTIGQYVFSNCKDLISINIPDKVNSIKTGSFEGCSNLTSVSIGKGVVDIDDAAFNNCTKITEIYCYAKIIPIIGKDPFKGVSRNATLWVPAEYYSEYKHDSFWGEFNVQPMGAESANTNKVVITPDYNTASVVWPQVSDVDSYELVIKDKSGNEVCTLVFNGDGQLQSIAFRAPAANLNDANRAPQQTQATGFRFTVTGLESGCTYNYTITAKDAAGKVLQTYTGSFTTLGATGVEDVETSGDVSLRHARKIYKDGNVLIITPDGRRFNLQGAEVK